MAVDTNETAPKTRIRRTNAEIAAARAAGVEPPKKETAPRRPKITAAGIRGMLSGAITLVDRALVAFAPVIWAPEDSLNPGEVNLLSAAVADELVRYPKAVNWLSRAGSASEHARLVYAVAVITAPRLARRNIIPGELAYGLVAGAMEAGTAPSDNRPNGNRQDNAS